MASAEEKTVVKSVESGIIDVDGKGLSKYIGQPITATDNQSIREWYVANVRNIINQVDNTQSIMEQAQQAYEMRNIIKHQARVAMSDTETAALLEKRRPAPSFEELIERKMKGKGLTREDAIKDILKTATKTNADVNKEFGL